MGPLLPLRASAQEVVVTPVVEKKVTQLPAGPLYWRIENFPTLVSAQSAAGPASLATEGAGKVWLFTLAAKGGSTPGASAVAEIGPVPALTAPEYLLRINRAGGPPGAKTPMHSHPGSETFYVLTGQVTVTTPSGVSHADAGQSMNGHAADTPMQVGSSGTVNLDQFVMFVVDAGKPFSTPAKF
jgi:mannose-6-phosphate isomerase-like protein (cupin superfamily)